MFYCDKLFAQRTAISVELYKTSINVFIIFGVTHTAVFFNFYQLKRTPCRMAKLQAVLCPI